MTPVKPKHLVGGVFPQQPGAGEPPSEKAQKPNEARYEAQLVADARMPVLSDSNQPEESSARIPGSGRPELSDVASQLAGMVRKLGCHVVDEEAEDAGLRRHVEKLGGDRQRKVRVRPDRMRDLGRGFVQMVIVLGLDVGNTGKVEDDGENDDHDCRHRRKESRASGCPCCCRLRPWNRKRCSRDRSKDPADAIAGLGEIDARGRVIAVGPSTVV